MTEPDFSIFTVRFNYGRDKKTRREICDLAVPAKLKSARNYPGKIAIIVGSCGPALVFGNSGNCATKSHPRY